MEEEMLTKEYLLTTDAGIKMKLYPAYDQLYLQLSKKAIFRPEPDWYYQITYTQL